MKKLTKVLFIVIVIIFIISIVFFLYMGIPKKVMFDNINDNQKNNILMALNLKFIPTDIELISVEIPKINLGPYYYINYSIDSSEKEKFIQKNELNTSKKSDIKQVKEKGNRIYYNQIVTQENDLTELENFVKNNL